MINILILVIAFIIIIILDLTNSLDKDNSPARNIKSSEPDTPYIKPHPFKTGYLSDPPQKVADLCNTSMCPVKQISVDYGPGKDCVGSCDNLVFNSPP